MSENVRIPKCKICNSIYRNDIEQDYVNWRSTQDIIERYPSENLNESNIRRHADHNTVIYERRSRNAKAVINRLLEKGLEHVDPKDIDIDQVRKLARDLLETEGQIKQGNNSSPTTVNVALIQGQGSDKLCIGAQRFGFGLVELNIANSVPVARETLALNQDANSTLLDAEYTIDPDPVGPPPNELDVRDVKTQPSVSDKEKIGEKDETH